MTQTDRSVTDLNALFTAARDAPPAPSADLMARVQADALSLQPVRAVQSGRSGAGSGLMHRVFAALGGWPTLAGAATAGIAGVWIGAGGVDLVDASIAALLYGDTSLSFDPLSGFDLTLLEG